MWMNPGDIISSEIIQAQKDKHRVIPLRGAPVEESDSRRQEVGGGARGWRVAIQLAQSCSSVRSKFSGDEQW